MLSRLKSSERVVGARQLSRAIQAGEISVVYIASDADLFVTRPIRDLCRESDIPVVDDADMRAIGEACGLKVKAAVAGIKR